MVHVESQFLTRLVSSMVSSDMRFIQQLSIREVNWERQPWWEPWPRLKYTTTAYKISLFGHAVGASTHCVAVRYSGKDAYAAWERDFLQYSNHHPNLVHLFGFNRQKSNPSLIFCDDVVTLMQVWEDCSPIVKSYIHHSFELARAEAKGEFRKICFGSQGPSETMPYEFKYGVDIFGSSSITLPFSLYHDEAGLKRYLLGMMGQKNSLLLGPSFMQIPFSYSLNDFTSTEVIFLPSVLWQGRDGLRQKFIGSFKNMDQSYSYILGPWRCDDNNGKLLGIGWTR
ncbi:hypothetical protein K435DRAFT_468811 [Dendrothele bispora CBS 962.96]|uniref:Protein kinase domain-containing protein n=1 Tax=Dendrothele bispora (strain CBS 962.96) TaxID=1314807 RepID=A0A4S8MDJ1_DENBC|nr:hypothetical protein K435DRAFT_468811 [Dendrothele bispora CBS 962.96]